MFKWRRKVFLSKILYLSKKERQLGIDGESNICGFYNKKELENIVYSKEIRTYYEHLIPPVGDEFIKFAIDYDNREIQKDPLFINKIKSIFIDLFSKFIIMIINKYDSEVYNRSQFKKELINLVAISKSVSSSSLHIVYPNVFIRLSTLISIMKVDEFKSFLAYYDDHLDEHIDRSIYKNNFNLRLINTVKHDKTHLLIVLTNQNYLDHIVTYMTKQKSYCIIY